MPYKANEARRHRIPRARYKVTNWPEYDRALQRRGSLTVWVTPEALAAWHPPGTGQRGRSRTYSDLAIETGHLLRLAFGRPWRQTEGLLRSLTALLGVDIGIPDHTTFSRRSPGLALAGSLADACLEPPRRDLAELEAEAAQDAPRTELEVVQPGLHCLCATSKARISCTGNVSAWTGRNQPMRSICAMPRASLRSVLIVIAPSAAFTCRVSSRTASNPASVRPACSHRDRGPASRPTRVNTRPLYRRYPTGASGSLATL